jgi:undecaprenyl-diphosphatase
MTLIHALILGIVEGITEFLPISSTGHLMLTTRLLGLAPTDFVKSFEIAIQLGAILAIVALYWRRLFVDRAVMRRIAVAFVPTAIIGLALYKFIKSYLLGSTSVVLWSLALGGLALVLFERWHAGKSFQTGESQVLSNELSAISYPQAALIGVFQSLAVVPGVSRAAATVIGGLLLGVQRRTIVEFSFLLAVPTMLAATLLDLMKSAGEFASADFGALAVGFLVSFVVALFAVRWLLRFIQSHTFTGFGLYRIALALAFVLFV